MDFESMDNNTYKGRIRFEKIGAAKFVGHLDTMRYFQKAIRRAEIPVAYSKDGFARGSVVAGAGEFNSLIDFVDGKIEEAGKEILKGRIDIEPYRENDTHTGCSFCDYREICKFESGHFGTDWKESPGLEKKEMEDVIYGRN